MRVPGRPLKPKRSLAEIVQDASVTPPAPLSLARPIRRRESPVISESDETFRHRVTRCPRPHSYSRASPSPSPSSEHLHRPLRPQDPLEEPSTRRQRPTVGSRGRGRPRAHASSAWPAGRRGPRPRASPGGLSGGDTSAARTVRERDSPRAGSFAGRQWRRCLAAPSTWRSSASAR